MAYGLVNILFLELSVISYQLSEEEIGSVEARKRREWKWKSESSILPPFLFSIHDSSRPMTDDYSSPMPKSQTLTVDVLHAMPIPPPPVFQRERR